MYGAWSLIVDILFNRVYVCVCVCTGWIQSVSQNQWNQFEGFEFDFSFAYQGEVVFKETRF